VHPAIPLHSSHKIVLPQFIRLDIIIIISFNFKNLEFSFHHDYFSEKLKHRFDD